MHTAKIRITGLCEIASAEQAESFRKLVGLECDEVIESIRYWINENLELRSKLRDHYGHEQFDKDFHRPS